MENNNLKIKKSYYKAIANISDRQAGEFIKGLCKYAFDGMPLTTKDAYLKGLYLLVQRDFEISRQNSLNAKKGVEKRRELKEISAPMTVVEAVFSREKSDCDGDRTGVNPLEKLFEFLGKSGGLNEKTERKADAENNE